VERLQREIDARWQLQPSRAALLLSAYARICVDGLADPLRATQALTRASELYPDGRFVASTWRSLAEQGADMSSVLQRARAELGHVGDNASRTALLWQIGAIEEHVVGDIAAAKRTIRELIALDPDDVGAWDAITALHLRSKTADDGWGGESASDESVFRGVVEALDVMAQATDDAVIQGALHSAAGALRDRYLEDDVAAIASLHRALEADDSNAGAQAALEAILLRRRSWDEYARVVAAQAERTRDPRTARECFERAGDVYAECIRDNGRAAHCYVRAATLAEADVGPVEKLAVVLEAAGRWEDAAAAYERLLTRVHEPQQKAWTLVRLGSLHEHRLHRPDDAFAAYRLAVDTSPTFAPAVASLIRVARARKLSTLVIELERREADRIADPWARAIRYAALAEVVETTTPATEATIAETTSLYERALALDGMNPVAFDALDRIFRASRQWPRLIALYESALANTTDPRRARALRLELGELYESRAKDPARAAEILREALSGPDDRFPTLIALARALADCGKWLEHVQALEAQASMLTGVEEIMAVHRIGVALETRVKDPERALRTYEIVLDRAPKHAAAARAILRIHEQEGRWEHVIRAERRLLELATRQEDVIEGLLRIAAVSEERLGRVDDAIAAYMDALDRAPGHGPALAALERLLRAKGDYRRLAQVLQRFADATPDRHLRARAMIRAATILELCMDDTDSASAAYGRALAVATSPERGDPDRDAALWGLVRLQETRSEWDLVDTTLHAILETTNEPAARMRVLVRRARNAELRMGDIGRAASLYEEALTTPGSGAEAGAFAVDRLRVARIASAGVGSAACLNAMSAATSDERLSASLLRVLALMREHTGAQDVAAKLYEQLVARDSADLQALDGLIRSAAATGDPRLAQAIIMRARATTDVQHRALLAFAAGIIEEGAGHATDAENAYTFALLAEPELTPLLDAARRLRAQASDWSAVASLSERAAKASLDADNVSQAWMDAADVYENRLGESVRATVAYKALLEAQPSHRKALERALFLLEAGCDWQTAADLLLAHAEVATDPAVRARCFTQRAALLAGRLGDIDGAISNLRQAMALGLAPDSDITTMQALALLEERAKHWQEALELHERIARAPALDGSARRRARLAAGRIYADELRDDETARRLLEELMRELPDDRDTIVRLAEVSARGGQEARALELYTQLSQSGSAVDRARILVALSDLLRSRSDLWPVAEADAALARAFDLTIVDASAIVPLEERFARDGDFRPFTAYADAAINRVAPNTQGILPLRVALAKIFRERLGNPDAADRHLAAAIKAFPDSIATRLALAANLRGRNDEAALAELRRAVEASPTSPEPFEALVTLAITTGRPEMTRMLASAATVLGADPDDLEATLDDVAPLRAKPDTLLVEEGMNRLVGPTRSWFLRSVLTVVDPFLPKLFPGAETVLEQRARLPDSYPIVGDVRDIAAALGCPPPIVCRGAGREAVLLLTEPRAIVLGNDLLSDTSRNVAMFHVAYICARIAAHGSIYTLPRQQIGSLLDAAAIPDADGPLIRDFRKRIDKVIPRKNRKELERILAVGTGDVRAELSAWEAEEARRSLYTAVVLSRDVGAVAEVLAADALGAQHPDDRRRAMSTNPALREVLEFVTSAACWDLFKRVYARG
jgi:cellulose synthase operon protein C